MSSPQGRRPFKGSPLWVLAGFVLLFLLVQFLNREDPATLITPDALLARMNEPGLVLLDVRTREEFLSGHIKGALHRDHRRFPGAIAGLSDQQAAPVVVYCETGSRSRRVKRQLEDAGFSNVLHLKGDLSAWRRQGHPVQRPAGIRRTP